MARGPARTRGARLRAAVLGSWQALAGVRALAPPPLTPSSHSQSTPTDQRGRPQVQLAETEAFSLNSDRSSSILLGDDLSLEDPLACLPGPKDPKVRRCAGLRPRPWCSSGALDLCVR